jgi:hypothetical protein
MGERLGQGMAAASRRRSRAWTAIDDADAVGINRVCAGELHGEIAPRIGCRVALVDGRERIGLAVVDAVGQFRPVIKYGRGD